MLTYVPMVVGILVWLVGGNLVLHHAMKREGRRWPGFPSRKAITLPEWLMLAACLAATLGCFATTALLAS